MTFLPIVERELRVAARRHGTYWLRVAAAGIALVIGCGMLLLSLMPFVGQGQSGSALFATLTWMSLAVALSAGLFFTSDCLSEEKREGTLGFLFLTDLRGYDVVLGKLLASSLRSVSPLLAVFPVLALTQLLGGVEVGQFWRTLLAIAHAAFFSLVAGLLVSTISRHSLRALGGTLVLMGLCLALGPFVDSLRLFVNGRFVPVLSLVSPGFVFVAADDGRNFWRALIVSQAAAWTLLALACVLVRRLWQERPTQSATSARTLRFARRPGDSQKRRETRATLLTKNPVTWLIARERGQAILLWAVALTVLVGCGLMLLVDPADDSWQVWSTITSGLWLVFYLWVAGRACQLFAEARRNGVIELLVATPLTSRETVEGAWHGLVRLFAPPVLLLICLQLVAGLTTNSVRQGFLAGADEYSWLGIVAVIAGVIVVPMNLIALAWFGLWMGLTSKNTPVATLKTIAFVQIIPWFAIYLITGLTIPLLLLANVLSTSGNAPSVTLGNFWLPFLFTALPSALALVKDVFLWRLARRKLFGQFRQLAVRSVVPIHAPTLPPVIAPAP